MAQDKNKTNLDFKNLGNYEVLIHTIKMKNPGELLEKLMPLKDDESMSNEEKNLRIQEIMREYME